MSVLFDPYRGLYKALLLCARVDLGAMAMMGYTTLSKTPALTVSSAMKTYSTFPKAAGREPHHRMA